MTLSIFFCPSIALPTALLSSPLAVTNIGSVLSSDPALLRPPPPRNTPGAFQAAPDFDPLRLSLPTIAWDMQPAAELQFHRKILAVGLIGQSKAHCWRI